MASQKIVAKKIRRRLDHLSDMQDGEPFAMIPQKLLRLWLNKEFPDAKMRLLCCFLTNAEYFHCKRTYLEGRFDSKTLKKYLGELISEGFLEVEERKRELGGVEKIYHVNSLHEWAPFRKGDALSEDKEAREESQIDDPGISQERQVADLGSGQERQVADPGQSGDRLGGDRLSGELNYINSNETKMNEIKTPDEKSERQEPLGDRVSERISFEEIEGAMRGLYDRFTEKSQIVSLVRHLCKKHKRSEVLSLIDSQYAKSRGPMKWTPEHREIWQRMLEHDRDEAEEVAAEVEDEVAHAQGQTYGPHMSLDVFPF